MAAMKMLKGALLCAALPIGLAGAASGAAAEDAMRISVSDGLNEAVFELVETKAAKSLYAMLPFTVKVENYSDNEKIFYPPSKVETGASEIESACPAGTLALFSPWGNVVMFYGPAPNYPGLYVLGKAVSGAGKIKSMSGSITASKAN
ncbi:MAG: cyclophilin-like fold protein [Aeromonadales bacterium]|nr:cyclophilin-like fold protein [Aeromonadales bacterium]MDY2890713.1 cyclophilin-like fold protein [Succinivibrio sp.]